MSGESPILSIVKRNPVADINWSGGLPPFQLQRTDNLESVSWANVGNPTLARLREIEMAGLSGFYRVQSEIKQLELDPTHPQTRLIWTVPDLAPLPGQGAVADLYPKPFTGVKGKWVENFWNQEHPATWNYTANPIPGRPSVGFHWNNPLYAASGNWAFDQHSPEVYVTTLFKSLRIPPRGMEVIDLYDVNEVCNIYQYPAGGNWKGGELALFMRGGTGGVTAPIPQDAVIRIWLRYQVTPTGAIARLAWAPWGQPEPTSGPNVINGSTSDLTHPNGPPGPIRNLLLGPVEGDAVFVFADLEVATFPVPAQGAPGEDSIDHFVLQRRVPEGAWQVLTTLSPEAREYIDPEQPNPTFQYWLRAFTASGQEWDYNAVQVTKATTPAAFQWQLKIQGSAGNSDNEARSVAVHSDGSSVITGYFATNADFGSGLVPSAGTYDAFVAKYAADGAYGWHRAIGATDNDQSKAVALDGEGNVLVHGFFQSQNLFFGPGFGPYSAQGSDTFLLKLNRDTGTTLWAKVFPGAGIEQARSVAADNLSNAIIGGWFGSNGGQIDLGFGPVLSNGPATDCYVAKYSGMDGTPIWARTFGSTLNDSVESIAVDQRDNSIVALGSFEAPLTIDGITLTPATAPDVFLMKFSPAGTVQWAKSFTGPYATAQGVAINAAGMIAAVGTFAGSIDFGNGITLTAHGNHDSYLACFNPDGVCQWALGWGSMFGGDALISVAASPIDNAWVITGWISSFLDLGGGYLPQIGGQDVLLAKFSAAGEHLWSKRYGGFGYDYGRDVAVGPDGGVFACGTFASSINFGGGQMTSGGQMLTSYLVKLGP